MEILTTKTIDLIALGLSLGVRSRDLSALKKNDTSKLEFEFRTEVVDDGIDGHVMIDHFDFIRKLNIISNALAFPFCLASYQILKHGVLVLLEKYSASDEALIDAKEAYDAEIEQMHDDALCDRIANNDWR